MQNDGWTVKCVVKTEKNEHVYIRKESLTGTVSIVGRGGYVHIGRSALQEVATALQGIANEPTTVDGMTALKHIMDGGGAYFIHGGERVAVRLEPPLFEDGHHVFRCDSGSTFHFGAKSFTDTDWVLFP